MAQLIRTAVDQVVDADTDETASQRRKALAVIGCFNSGLTDVSERHDDYLAEAYTS
ncbi:MAG: hypothetical protein FD164_2274 [Nitrospirae bacterium]|nr:MAG: hypothetical protein FD164_2274 [Nitrospirota bacterium]